MIAALDRRDRSVASVRVDHVAAVELALESGLTSYDASYLHLARHLAIPLVTFDDQLGSVVGP